MKHRLWRPLRSRSVSDDRRTNKQANRRTDGRRRHVKLALLQRELNKDVALRQEAVLPPVRFRLVPWRSGRTLVFDWRAFDLQLTGDHLRG